MSDPNDPDDDHMPRIPSSAKRQLKIEECKADWLAEDARAENEEQRARELRAQIAESKSDD